MRRAINIKKTFALTLPLIYIAILYYYLSGFSFSEIKVAYIESPKSIYGIIALVLLINFLVLSLRIKFVYTLLGHKITSLDAAKTSFASQVGGLFFIPFLGSMFGQTIALQKKKLPEGLAAVAALLERIMMLVSGIMACESSVILMYQNEARDFVANNSNFWIMLVIIAISFFITIMFILPKTDRQFCTQFLTKQNVFYMFQIFALGLMTWLTMASAYAFALYILAPSLKFTDLLQSAFIVSFISSLPISVNGWGIREAIAIKVFGMNGISVPTASLVAISIGIISILCIPFIASLLHLAGRLKNSASAQILPLRMIPSRQINSIIINILGYTTCILIFFNVYIAHDTYRININPADLIAMCSLLILGLKLFSEKIQISLVIPQFRHFIYVITATFLVALFVGYLNFGYTTFAFISKFAGWFILVGYTSVGILVAHYLGHRGIYRLISVMGTVLALVTVLRILMELLVGFYVLDSSTLTPNFEGFSQNRNALACQFLVVISLLQARMIKLRNSPRKTFDIALLAILYYGLILTMSRATHFLIPLMITSLFALKIMRFNGFVKLSIGVIFIFLALELTSSITVLSILHPYSGQGSDIERVYAIKEALRLWWQSPLFGIGLGGFIHHELAQSGRSLVIHNTFIWWLVEFGLIGFSVFSFFGVYVGKHCLSIFHKVIKLRQKITFKQAAFVLIAIVFCTLSLAHEIMYQRIFWLAWGFLIIGDRNTVKHIKGQTTLIAAPSIERT